jgi:hypothetical protein
VAVQVTEEQQLTFCLHLLNQVFYRENRRVLLRARLHPDSVEIDTNIAAAGVAINNAVWVEHWHYFEHEVVSEHPCAQAWTYQVVNDAFHHELAARLTGMNPAADYNSLALPHFFILASECCNDQHVDVISRHALAHCFATEAQLLLGVGLERVQVAL